MIEGTHEIVVTLVFSVPPGQDPVEGAKKLAHNGFSVASGLLPYVKRIDVNVQECQVSGSRLEIV